MTALDQFRTVADPFTDVVTDLPADAWAQPSPCEGWSAADVVHHVITTQHDFLSQQGVLDQGIETASITGDPGGQWQAHQDRVAGLLADPAVAERTYDGAFGPTTIGATMSTFFGFDLIVHRWDVARAVGTDTRFTDDELKLLESSITGFGDHLYAEGICRPPVTVDPDASRQRRVLGLLGRTA